MCLCLSFYTISYTVTYYYPPVRSRARIDMYLLVSSVREHARAISVSNHRALDIHATGRQSYYHFTSAAWNDRMILRSCLSFVTYVGGAGIG